MKKQGIPLLIVITLVFGAFTFGYFLGQNRAAEPVTVSVPDVMEAPPQQTSLPETTETVPAPTTAFPIDLNSAEKEDLMALPGIGEVLAQRILDYREANGPYASPGDVMNVEGIGKKRFEQIQDLITIGG